jgi:hypothetical protein
MKDVFSVIPEFFFDIIGMFIPGVTLILAFTWMDMQIDLNLYLQKYEVFVILLISYLTGHILYGLSTFIVANVINWFGHKPKENWLDINHEVRGVSKEVREELIHEIKKCSGEESVVSKNEKYYYEFCRNYLHTHSPERAGFVRKQQAYGELARSMVVVALICILVSLLPLVSNDKSIIMIPLSVFSIIFFGWRYIQARSIDALFVYTNFLVLRKSEKASNHI